jgi:hypothetical protein
VERRKILPVLGLELQLHGCPAHSQSLYRLHYPGIHVKHIQIYSYHLISSPNFVMMHRSVFDADYFLCIEPVNWINMLLFNCQTLHLFSL